MVSHFWLKSGVWAATLTKSHNLLSKYANEDGDDEECRAHCLEKVMTLISQIPLRIYKI